MSLRAFKGKMNLLGLEPAGQHPAAAKPGGSSTRLEQHLAAARPGEVGYSGCSGCKTRRVQGPAK